MRFRQKFPGDETETKRYRIMMTEKELGPEAEIFPNENGKSGKNFYETRTFGTETRV